jgi:hypothetical protein
LEFASLEIDRSLTSAALLRRLIAVQLLTQMAEGRPLRALVLAFCWYYLSFFLPAGEPKGRIFCSFTAAGNAYSVPSGTVPGDDVGGRDVEFFYESGGGGPDGVLLLSFRVLLVKAEDYVVLILLFEVLFVKCNPTAPY